jgi:hypothetical protein
MKDLFDLLNEEPKPSTKNTETVDHDLDYGAYDDFIETLREE